MLGYKAGCVGEFLGGEVYIICNHYVIHERSMLTMGGITSR